MSALDTAKALIFTGGTIPTTGASAGDLAAEIAAREALAGEVAEKADTVALAALAVVVDGKADQTAVDEQLAQKVSWEDMPVNQESPPGEILVSVVDGEGNITFMTASTDRGKPAPFASRLIEEGLREVGVPIPEARETSEFERRHLFIVRDEAGNISPDLLLSREDGTFTDDALRSFGPRLLALNGGGTASRPNRDGTWAHPGGGRFAYYDANMADIVGWGSSSIALSADHMSAMASGLGAAYINKTKGSQTNSHVALQLGALKPRCTGAEALAAPAASFVAVAIAALLQPSAIRTTSGSLVQDGVSVAGDLSWSAALASLIFTRSGAGPVIDLSGAPVTFVSDEEILRDRMAVIWSGKNDINAGQSADQVLASTTVITDYLSPFAPRMIVLGHFQNLNWSQGGDADLRLRALEEMLAETYGRLFVPVLPSLISAEIFDALSISPTPDDTARMAAGMTPPSLMRDDGHLTDAAYAWVCENLVQPKLTAELGWYKEAI